MSASDTPTNRRRFLKVAGVGTAGLLAGCSGGDGGDGGGDGGDGGDGGGGTPTATEGMDFPSKDITIVIPYPPGGGFDSYCRLMANEMTQRLDVNVQATNISGGGGRIATEQVFNANPDGHTFMLLDGDAAPVEQVREDVDYDLTEFTILGAPLQSVNVTSVAKWTEITSVEGYADAVKDGLVNCSPGRTDPGVLGPYLFGQSTGLYDPDAMLENALITQGTAECITAAEREDIGATTTSASSSMRAGRLEVFTPILHYSFEEENPFPDKAPDMQTMAMAGYSEDEVGTVVDLLSGTWPWAAPPDLPEERANFLRDTLWDIMNSDTWASAMSQADLKNVPTEADEAESILEGSLEAFEENIDLIDRLG